MNFLPTDLRALAADIEREAETALQVINRVADLLQHQSAFEASMGCHDRASELRMAARIARGALDQDKAVRPIHPERRASD